MKRQREHVNGAAKKKSKAPPPLSEDTPPPPSEDASSDAEIKQVADVISAVISGLHAAQRNRCKNGDHTPCKRKDELQLYIML